MSLDSRQIEWLRQNRSLAGGAISSADPRQTDDFAVVTSTQAPSSGMSSPDQNIASDKSAPAQSTGPDVYTPSGSTNASTSGSNQAITPARPSAIAASRSPSLEYSHQHDDPVWQQGFQAGLQNPSTDIPPPADLPAEQQPIFLDGVAAAQADARKAPPSQPAAVPPSNEPVPLRDVTSLSVEDKLIAAYEKAPFGPAMRSQIEGLVTPKALVIALLSFAGAFVVSQVTPVGWAADIGLAITGIFVGAVIFDAVKHLIAFTDARSAKDDEDLQRAGDHLAEAFSEIAVNALIAIVLHGSKGGGGAAPYKAPPPTGFVEVVTTTGLVVRMPAQAAEAVATTPMAMSAQLGAKAGVAGAAIQSGGGGGGGSGSGGSSASGPPQNQSSPVPPSMQDKPGFELTDFDKQTAGTGGIKNIRKGPDPEGLYGVTIEGEMKDPIADRSANAPNYNQSSKLIDPEGPGLQPAEWEKSHAVGPGFGDEAAAGLMEAPREMNQLFQNRGIEGWMRELHQAAKGAGGTVKYKVSVVPWRFPTPSGWSPTSGAEFLRLAEYRVQVEIPNRPPISVAIQIETAPPPAAKVANVTIEPSSAVNPTDLF